MKDYFQFLPENLDPNLRDFSKISPPSPIYKGGGHIMDLFKKSFQFTNIFCIKCKIIHTEEVVNYLIFYLVSIFSSGKFQ